MKKIILPLIVFGTVLAGCSEPNKSVADQLPTSTKVEQVEEMDRDVHIYSLQQNTTGYVVEQDKRDKWIVTNASVVATHPYVLVETSTQQLLKGKVVYLNSEYNIALISINNTVNVETELYKDEYFSIDEGGNLEFNSFDKNGNDVLVTNEILKEALHNTSKDILPFEDRIKVREIVEDYPLVVENKINKIDDYSKDNTFKFDRDAVEIEANRFITLYNQFTNEKNDDLLAIIKNDELMKVFTEWEVFGEKYTFYEPKVTSVNYENFVYSARFEAIMGKSERKHVEVLVNWVKYKEKMLVQSFSIMEKK